MTPECIAAFPTDEDSKSQSPVFCPRCHREMALFMIAQKNSENDSKRTKRNKVAEILILNLLYQTTHANVQISKTRKIGINGIIREEIVNYIITHFKEKLKLNTYSVTGALDGLISKQLIAECTLGTLKLYFLTSDGLAVHHIINNSKST